jgi:ATP/maltotriose-dependent transcriptional regulator MalT
MAREIEAADHYLALGLAISDRHGHCATCHALLYPAAVSVHIARGALSQAEAFCRQLEQASSAYQSRTWVAMARQSRGELAAAQGDLETSLACYEEASQAFKTTGNQYEAARCLSAMAEIRRKRKLPGDAKIAKIEASEAGLILERLNVG